MTLFSRIAHFVFAPVISMSLVVLLTAGCSESPQSFETLDSVTSLHSIIGGVALKKDHYVAKTTALLYNADLNSNFCTVTVLSSKYAITAAHCIEIARPESFYLEFGTVSNPANPRRRVSKVATLPGRETQVKEIRNSFDVALVKFEGGLPPGYQAAVLLPEKYEKNFKAGTLAAVAGYGLDNLISGPVDTLRLVDLRISNPNFTVTEVLLDQTNGRGACKGDSGGPAYFYIGGKFYLWGVASRGVNREGELVGDCAQYVAYSKAALFITGLTERLEQ